MVAQRFKRPRRAMAGLAVSFAIVTIGGPARPEAGAQSPRVASAADLDARRQAMVERQIRGRGVRNEAVLAAMAKVPRHRFVPQNAIDLAYADSPLAIGHSQTISQPFIVAYMSEALGVGPEDRVLEIGTGSGYQAAVLAEVAKEVFTIEIVPELADGARTVLQTLGYRNIRFRTGDGYQGWPEAQPFDGIIVTAAPDHVPEPLVQQLAPGARMVIPVGREYQKLIVITRTPEGVVRQETLDVRFVPLLRKPR